MKDNFVLVIICCCIFAVFASKQIKGNDTRISYSGMVRTKPNPQLPDNRYFDWELCKALHATEKKNAVVSTLSAKLVLLMIYEGALGNTAKQIEQSIGFFGRGKEIKQLYSHKLQSLQDHDKDDYELDIGTKLFIDTSVKLNDEFLTSTTASYNSSYQKVDFSKPVNAAYLINQWAQLTTHGHVKELITADETDKNTVLLLLNAIYFKGGWKNQFDKNLTKMGEFYLNSQSAVNVPLMTTYNNFNISSLKSLNARIISLPYKGDKFVMYIVLPDSYNGLDNLINTFNPTILNESIKNMTTVFAKVVLPKFNFEYTSVLAPLLKKLGITDMFGTNANLSNIGHGPFGRLMVSSVLQKAGIEINEEGSIAHAVTEASIGNRFGESLEHFEVNRPFLFMLEDINTQTIVFVGQVIDPFIAGSPEVSNPVSPTLDSIKPISNDLDFKMNQEPDENVQRFNFFDSELFEELSSNEVDSNFIASPISIKIILSLLSEGARGDTLNQLYDTLRLPNDQSTRHNLLRQTQLSMKSSIMDVVVVNNIFVQKNIISNYFKETAKDLYSANISEINVGNIEASIQMINKQISLDTRGLVKNIVSKDDFDGNTQLLLANILYFKGEWLVEFNEKNTKKECFYTKPNECVEVNMMYLNDDMQYQYISTINAHAVELLYKDTNFSMVILLPERSITNLFRDLQHYPLSKVLTSFQKRNVHLHLPRFSINYSTKLMSVLQKMKLTSIFGQKANLSSIFDPATQVFVKDVIHKVTIEVNEKGSKASAVTALTVMTLSYSPTKAPVIMNVNKPFGFYIINRITKSVLFGGQIHDVNLSNPILTMQKGFDIQKL